MVYPEELLKKNQAGYSVVMFSIDTLGLPHNTYILTSRHKEFDKEVIRLTKELPHCLPCRDKDGKLSTQITVQDKLGLDGKSKITLLEDKYDAIAITGTLDTVKQNNGKTTYNIKVLDPKYNGADYKGATTSGDQTYVTYTLSLIHI